MHDARKHARLSQERTNGIAMSIAKFGTLDKKELSVRRVDIGAAGMGIEAEVPLEPGFVWFPDNAEHQKCGVVVWTREDEKNAACRAGIKFISLGPGSELAALASVPHSYPPSCRAPELVACMLVDEVPPAEGPV